MMELLKSNAHPSTIVHLMFLFNIRTLHCFCIWWFCCWCDYSNH